MVKVSSLIDDVDFISSQSAGNHKLQSGILKEGITSELELRVEKLGRLRREFAIETDPNTLFKLEKDIEVEEEKIANIENRLDEML
jgi:hypothetical protein